MSNIRPMDDVFAEYEAELVEHAKQNPEPERTPAEIEAARIRAEKFSDALEKQEAEQGDDEEEEEDEEEDDEEFE